MQINVHRSIQPFVLYGRYDRIQTRALPEYRQTIYGSYGESILSRESRVLRETKHDRRYNRICSLYTSTPTHLKTFRHKVHFDHEIRAIRHFQSILYRETQ